MELFENLNDNKGIYLLNSNDENKFISYKSLYNKALGYLESLHDLGLKRGAEIVFQIDDNETFIIAFWAAIFGGMVPVPLQSVKTDDNLVKLKNVLSILRKPVILASYKNIDKIKNIKEIQIINAHQKINQYKYNVSNIDSDCTALIQFSSGSTGEPKGIELSHKNILSCIKSLVKSLNINRTDSGISWMPLTHNMGLIGFHIAMIYAGLDQYLMQTELFLTNPLSWMEFIHKNKITITSSPNFGYKYFLKFLNNKEKQWDLSHLKMIINGAEPISVELCKAFENILGKYGLNKNVITPAYGLAEATVAVSVSKSNDVLQSFVLNRENLKIIDTINASESKFEQLTFTDVGYPIDDMKIRICDENDRELDENIVGNIQLKSPCIMKGYYMNDKATQEAFTDDKWLKTGVVYK
jgi:acyl-CoA synthetase (AMP-forming)/AMP-acid ligase II